jgi:hypothetical protein
MCAADNQAGRMRDALYTIWSLSEIRLDMVEFKVVLCVHRSQCTKPQGMQSNLHSDQYIDVDMSFEMWNA